MCHLVSIYCTRCNCRNIHCLVSPNGGLLFTEESYSYQTAVFILHCVIIEFDNEFECLACIIIVKTSKHIWYVAIVTFKKH